MSLKNLPPTASNLYAHRDRIAKSVLDKALTEARELARWAGERIPNGPAAGAFMHGYNIGSADLELAVAMIVARVRAETYVAILDGTGEATRERLSGAKPPDVVMRNGVLTCVAEEMALKCKTCGGSGCLSSYGLKNCYDCAGSGKAMVLVDPLGVGGLDALTADEPRKMRPRKEKIPSHNRLPTGKRPKSSKGKCK